MYCSENAKSTAESGSDSWPWLGVWDPIVSELARQQDAASPGHPGSVVNPICGVPYILDTCCAARVFATEYRRTDETQWKKRADDAVRAARTVRLFPGISEPVWDVLGWHDAPESLPPTGMAVDAYWGALDLLGLPLDQDDARDLLEFLSRCRGGGGGFAHNALIKGREAAEVQNATASTLNIMGRLALESEAESHPLYEKLDAALSRLRQGQSTSGFWPYHYPGSRLREALSKLPFAVLLRPRRFFSYNGHGDVMHHLMTLYFSTGFFLSSRRRAETGMLASGWAWIKKQLVRGQPGGLCINWEVDPAPQSPRFSNSRDTNAYFLMLATIPRLADLGIVDKDESGHIAKEILLHIGSNLMSEAGCTPCVIPHEGPPEILRNILPMFEQSVAWKGCLLSEMIRTR